MCAYIYMQQRDYKMAKADYERLLKVNPTSYNGRLGFTLEIRRSTELLNTMIAAKGENRDCHLPNIPCFMWLVPEQKRLCTIQIWHSD